MTVTCTYCDHEGEYGVEIEIRNGRFACIDTTACDDRDEARWYVAEMVDSLEEDA